jgi:Ankyrin repeats (many copies)
MPKRPLRVLSRLIRPGTLGLWPVSRLRLTRARPWCTRHDPVSSRCNHLPASRGRRRLLIGDNGQVLLVAICRRRAAPLDDAEAHGRGWVVQVSLIGIYIDVRRTTAKHGSLLDAGAEVDAQDSEGNTPLMKAVFASIDNPAMIRLLLAAGANRKLKNKHGVSPLSLARDTDHPSLANWLKLPTSQ